MSRLTINLHDLGLPSTSAVTATPVWPPDAARIGQSGIAGDITYLAAAVRGHPDADGVIVLDLIPTSNCRATYNLIFDDVIWTGLVMPTTDTTLTRDLISVPPHSINTIRPSQLRSQQLPRLGREVTVGPNDTFDFLPRGGGPTSGEGLPDVPAGSARYSLRFNPDDAAWEAYSDESTWYYALTTDRDLDMIAAVLVDAITNGFNRRVRGSNATHFNPSIADIVLTKWNIPYYPVIGAHNSWTADGDADAAATFSADSYSWLILPKDTAADAILNRNWTISPRTGGSGEAAGQFSNNPAYTPVNSNLLIDGVRYLVARAAIHWVAGTTNWNFGLAYNPQEDTPTVVIVEPE